MTVPAAGESELSTKVTRLDHSISPPVMKLRLSESPSSLMSGSSMSIAVMALNVLTCSKSLPTRVEASLMKMK